MKAKLLLILWLTLLASANTSFAQWVRQQVPTTDATLFTPVPRGKNVMWLKTGNYVTDTTTKKAAEFVRTADGGKTYVKGKLLDDLTNFSYDIEPLPDGKTAYFFGNSNSDPIYFAKKTVDSGKTFQDLAFKPQTPPDLFYFFDDKNGVYIGEPDSLGFVFEYSNDGGNSFTRVDPGSLPAMRPQEVGTQGQSGYTTVGNVLFFQSYDNDSGDTRFWRSTDEGRSWTAGAWFSTEDYFVARAAFADSIHGMLVRGIATQNVQPLFTNDGGMSWQESVGNLPGETTFPISVLPGTQTYMAFFGDRTRNKLFSAITNDYGKTWNSYKDIAPYTLDSIYLPDIEPFDFTNLRILDNHTAWGRFDRFDLEHYASDTPLIPEKPDLELTLVADNDQPSLYTYVKFTLTITNRGISQATGVKVNWLPPYNRTPGAGGSYAYTAAYASKGNYDSWHGIWTIDDLQPNETQTVSFHLYVLRADVNVVQSAQVTACNEQDLDSTPNNMGATPKEDDETQYVFKAAGAIAFPANASEKAAASYSVGPNPARDFVNVFYDSKELAEATIIITDVTGRIVQSENIGQAQTGSSRLNTSGLAAGIYVVSVVRKDDQTRLMTQRLSIVH